MYFVVRWRLLRGRNNRFVYQNKHGAEDFSQNKMDGILYLPFYSPGDGFEPPLKEPESFVLPLDDPGLFNYHAGTPA